MPTNIETTFYYLSFGTYALAALMYIFTLAFRKEQIGKATTGVTILGLVFLTVSLAMRTSRTGYLPFTNMYEYSASFAWGIVFVYLIAEFRYKFRAMGSFVMPVAFIILATAAVLGGKEADKLVPALQSNWLNLHVATAVIAYGAYAVSFGLAIMYLIKDKMVENKSRSSLNEALPAPEVLDEMSYRAIAFSFPFMSIVIISGAIWAEYAWGRYWSWDPKETWSLITWLVYAAYLHARFTYGWRGHRAAWLAIIGFLTVLFTYFGVNLFLSGLHAYTG